MPRGKVISNGLRETIVDAHQSGEEEEEEEEEVAAGNSKMKKNKSSNVTHSYISSYTSASMLNYKSLEQRWAKSALEGRYPAGFSCFPALTHLMLISSHHHLVIKVSTSVNDTDTCIRV